MCPDCYLAWAYLGDTLLFSGEPAAAIVHYQQGRDERVDASLDRLLAIIEDGMVTQLVLFEMAARVHPQYTLTLDEEERQRLKAYVLKHVLLPAAAL